MALIAGTGDIAKIKAIVVSLSGFTGTGTSNFGDSTDINCDDVEYLSVGRPSTKENDSEDIYTNMRTFTECVENSGWDDWDALELYNDENAVNYKACIAAKECGSTGTLTLSYRNGATIGRWRAQVSNVDGSSGDANSFDTSFTPTFTLIESLSF